MLPAILTGLALLQLLLAVGIGRPIWAFVLWIVAWRDETPIAMSPDLIGVLP